jgi:Uma2 family endonuclease
VLGQNQRGGIDGPDERRFGDEGERCLKSLGRRAMHRHRLAQGFRGIGTGHSGDNAKGSRQCVRMSNDTMRHHVGAVTNARGVVSHSRGGDPKALEVIKSGDARVVAADTGVVEDRRPGLKFRGEVGGIDAAMRGIDDDRPRGVGPDTSDAVGGQDWSGHGDIMAADTERGKQRACGRDHDMLGIAPMDADPIDVLSRHPVPRYRLTVDDYHRLGEAGILGENDRVELLEGQLVNMSPIGPRHALVVDVLYHLLSAAAGDRAWVRGQNPIALDGTSEPQPDIVLVRRPWAGYPTAHPGPDDVFLIVEVADSSREVDLGAKRELYARAGIREFWVVDLTNDVVVVSRDPRDDAYGSVISEATGTLEVAALPGVTIAVRSLFI